MFAFIVVPRLVLFNRFFILKKNSMSDFKGLWIPARVWECKDLSLIEKCFLCKIYSLDNKDGCIAGNAFFADFFDISKSRCTQILKELEDRDFIKITLIRDGKEITKRVVNLLNRGIEFFKHPIEEIKHPIEKIKQGYLENSEDKNINKTIEDKNIKEESTVNSSPSFGSSNFEILQNQIAELSKQILSLKTEKEKEKSSAKKEKEKIGDTPLVTPPHKTDIEQSKPKPYQVAIQDFDFSIFPESLRNAFFSFCESVYEKSKGKFSGTQAKELIRVVKIDINKAGVEKVEKCLQLCTLSGWNYDITYQLNKELRERQDEIKRNKQYDDPTISTVESAVRARFGENLLDDRHKNGYNPLPMPWETDQEF